MIVSSLVLVAAIAQAQPRGVELKHCMVGNHGVYGWTVEIWSERDGQPVDPKHNGRPAAKPGSHPKPLNMKQAMGYCNKYLNEIKHD